MTQRYALGVDAGNTKTTVLVSDVDGRLLGRADTGPGDIYGASHEDLAITAVLEAVDRGLTAAGLRPQQIEAATFCLAGVDWPEDALLWSQALSGHLPAAHLQVLNDGFALLWCLSPDGVGVAINVGTGPAVAARNSVGTTAFMGFWCQHPLGSVGLGEKALQAVFLAELGMAQPTALREAMLERFAFDHVEELLHEFTRRGAPTSWKRLAATAPTVLACASAGDPASLSLLTDQARLLLNYARAIAARAGLDLDRHPSPLALGGGVMGSDLPVFKQILLSEAALMLPSTAPVVIDAEPASGALVGAVRQLDTAAAEQAFTRLMDPARPAAPHGGTQ